MSTPAGAPPSPGAGAPDPLDVLRARGFVQDVTDEEGLRAALAAGPITYYVGFDPTAPSLHAGNLVGIMAMAWLQRMGHRPIALAGGGTGRIGDPSGRDDERQLLDEATIAVNLAGIRGQLSRFLDLGAPERGLLLDNHDWLGRLGFLSFLRDVGKHVSVNQMVARESVRRRLEEREQGLSFTEFSYQLLQAYDFAHLYATQGCVLQGGGSDQWGNITAGTDLVRRLHGGAAFGLVWPLLTTAAGAKFGKSAGNAVWLDADRTSPYAYYQYWINASDQDVERFLLLFTFLDAAEVADLVAAHAEAPHRRLAQRRLAEEATRLCHGEEGLAEARRATEVLFGDAPFEGLSDAVLAEAFAAAPSVDLPADALDGGTTVVDLLVAAGAAASASEARRLVAQGGVRLNNVVVDEATRPLRREDLATAATLVLRVGRKRYFLARLAQRRG
jgi:tyrosyl-tRNA synthetase